MLPSLRCEQVLAAILESAEEAIIGITLDGAIKLWSRGAELLYGYSVAEVTGVALISLLPIYEGPSLQAALQAARRGKMTDGEKMLCEFEGHRSGVSVGAHFQGGLWKDQDIQLDDVRSLVLDLTDFMAAIAGKYTPRG